MFGKPWVCTTCACAIGMLAVASAAAQGERDSVAFYVARALQLNPEHRAAYEQWQGALHRARATGRLPDPVLQYGFFARPVETRVGPQRQRVALRQMFPWPGTRGAQTAAAEHRAEAYRLRFQSQALEVAARVAEAYWRGWRLQRELEVHGDHIEILASLAGTARARVETGKATLANLAQVDLRRSRLQDMLAALRERKRATAAHLRAAVGMGPEEEVAVSSNPPVLRSPEQDERGLRSALQVHPGVRALRSIARGRLASAEAVDAAGMPSFGLAAQWIETAPARTSMVDSGQDALLVTASATLPLGRGRVRQQVAAERAAARADEQRAIAARQALQARLASTCASLRDSLRRARLYEHTLIPQGTTVLEAVLGSYQTGRSSIAEVLLAQQDLVELQLGLIDAQAIHATAWARLQAIVGRPLDAGEAPDE